MSKLPRNVKPQKLIKFLVKFGFKEGKGKGSHIRLAHTNGKWTQVAVHPGPIPEGHNLQNWLKVVEDIKDRSNQ